MLFQHYTNRTTFAADAHLLQSRKELLLFFTVVASIDECDEEVK
jgi:hypothetical protein